MPDEPATTLESTENPTPLHTELDQLRTSLAEAQHNLSIANRRRELDIALLRAGAIDIDAARLLAEHDMASSASDNNTNNNAPTPADAVNTLKRTRPFLFNAHAAPTTTNNDDTDTLPGPLSPMPDHDSAQHAQLTTAATRAATQGDRASLLTYLRLRRASA